MGTHTIYLPKKLKQQMYAEIIKRQRKGKQVGESKIVQEALKIKYRKGKFVLGIGPS